MNMNYKEATVEVVEKRNLPFDKGDQLHFIKFEDEDTITVNLLTNDKLTNHLTVPVQNKYSTYERILNLKEGDLIESKNGIIKCISSKKGVLE